MAKVRVNGEKVVVVATWFSGDYVKVRQKGRMYLQK